MEDTVVRINRLAWDICGTFKLASGVHQRRDCEGNGVIYEEAQRRGRSLAREKKNARVGKPGTNEYESEGEETSG